MGGGIRQVIPNRHARDEHKEVRGGITGEGKVLSEEDESRMNEVAEDVNAGRGGADASLALPTSLQKQQLQPRVVWERFLPVRTLKVLLVENDDSTRQVVSALLRNCNYEVTAAANVLQAWKILEDLTNHIDLVLTEVVMPCLSGIVLLCKIMSHKTRKNIPVIMMSSNDSMPTVFKCLSKGAVDFLVKPIRKNELKNLWQHVWRRSHNSSGSGSDSGIQTEMFAKSKSADDFDNNIGSNDEGENGINGLNISDGSDNGSGTQSSRTKCVIEVDSPQPVSPSDKPANLHDSTCAQVTHPKIETLAKERMPMTTNRECQEQKGIADVEIGVPRNPDTQHDSYPADKVSSKLTSEIVDILPKSDPKGSNASDKPNTEAADLIGIIANSNDAQVTTRVTEASERKDMAVDRSMDIPSLKLSLKRLRSTEAGGTVTHDDRNVLRRSNISAFSRYHTCVASTQASTGYGGSYSPLDNDSEAVKPKSTDNVVSDSNAALLKQGSNGSSDNIDMGSTTKTAFTEKTVYASLIQPVHTSAFHHYHHPHRHAHHMQQLQVPLDHDVLIVKTVVAVAPDCLSSVKFGGPMEGNVSNYSLNGSISGSNHGSNGQNGSSTVVNAGGVNAEGVNGITERNGTVGGNGSGSSSGVDQSRSAQREAALNKFRQKRKERNFQKKVRYHSRKRLAEKRPRVRGQFVRRALPEDTGREADR